MGRELQKKKNRSSVAKVRHKALSKKKILHNPIVAANWDQKETLSQNYRRLGLSSRLNYPTGGTERLGSSAAPPADDDSDEQDPPADTTSSLRIATKAPTTLNITTTRVERDPETGAIVSVLDLPPPPPQNPLNDPLNSTDDAGWRGLVNEHGLLPGVAQPRTGTTETVRALEAAAARPAARRVRQQSEREREWVGRLVERHGEDYRAMSRDARLNVMQQSEGDIKRRVKKWRAAQQAGSA